MQAEEEVEAEVEVEAEAEEEVEEEVDLAQEYPLSPPIKGMSGNKELSLKNLRETARKQKNSSKIYEVTFV